MKRAYYTSLNMISINMEYSVEVEGHSSRISIPMATRLIGNTLDPVNHILYNEVKKILGNDDFFLIPSAAETEMIAYLTDKANHPEKYPMSCDCSINPWSGGCDCGR